MNEGGCDPDGRFYCGSMAYDRRPGAGAVYRLDPELSTQVVLEGATISNGLDWSPDGELAYYNDTETYRTDVFDYAPESGLTNRRPFVEFEPDDGRPDGLTVDAEGGVWVAMNGAGAVRHYSPAGALEEKVSVPAAKVHRLHLRRRRARRTVHHHVAREPAARCRPGCRLAVPSHVSASAASRRGSSPVDSANGAVRRQRGSGGPLPAAGPRRTGRGRAGCRRASSCSEPRKTAGTTPPLVSSPPTSSTVSRLKCRPRHGIGCSARCGIARSIWLTQPRCGRH